MKITHDLRIHATLACRLLALREDDLAPITR